ncbi:MAG: hypothetical protein ABI647_04890 [Gemmatimonadota bacterium]
MPCCGQGRSDLRRAMAAPSPTPQAPPDNVSRNRGTVTLVYLSSAPMAARGSATGTLYRFDGGRGRHYVDQRDASGLLRTGLFRRLA